MPYLEGKGCMRKVGNDIGDEVDVEQVTGLKTDQKSLVYVLPAARKACKWTVN